MSTKKSISRIFSAFFIAVSLLALTFSALGVTPARAAGVCFVDMDAVGTNSGASWANAYTDLQSALGVSGCTEVWVAAGTYKPTTGTDRAATFQLINGVAIYGGFAGTETARGQRLTTNLTILCGDLLGNDNSNIKYDESTRADNSYHVVTGATGATLDGFTITAGNANASGLYCAGYCGGGMYNSSSSPTLTNVTFSGNSASSGGGGMYNSFSSPSLTNVTFSGNSTSCGNTPCMFGSGGGMQNYVSSPVLTNVTFSSNSAGQGGGMRNDSSSPMLTNVTFSDNSAVLYGGVMWNYYSVSGPSIPQIRNTIFWGNTAGISGAQIYNYDSSYSIVSNSVVQGGCPATGIGSLCTNIKSTDPLLGTLGNYGGFTQTIPLGTGSSAIDATSTNCPATDQRGIARPQDGDGNGSAICDIGSYEVPSLNNTLPTISDITDKNADENTATGEIPFTVGDAETSAASLVVTATSSNTTLVPNGNITLGGSGANRTISIMPASDRSGTTTITVNVSDGTNTTSDTFLLTINATPVSYSISGNAGVASATITYIGGSIDDFTTADGSGLYSFTVPSGWSGTVTPSKSGYAFTPSSRTYPGVLANQTNQNFAATVVFDPNYLWHTFYGGGSGSFSDGYSIASDGSGNVYVAGTSDGAWDGPGSIAPLNAYTGGKDIVVVKLDSAGEYQWHTFFGTSGDDYGQAVTSDEIGNVYVTGSSGAWTGSDSTAPLNAHAGDSDIMVIKLNTAGAYQWHTFYGSTGSDGGTAITSDASGNLYVAGGSATSWNGPVSVPPLNGFGSIVVIKLNSAGAYQWHTLYGSGGNEGVSSITLAANGSIYMAGTSYETWDGPNSKPPLNAYVDGDIVVIKLNSAGAYQWHTFFGSYGIDYGYSITSDAFGDIYVSGTSDGTWEGPGSTQPLNAYTGGYDITVVKLNSMGAYQWHTFYGSASEDIGYAISSDWLGNLYVTGDGCANWNGPGSVQPLNAHTDGCDITVLKLNRTGAYQWHTFYGNDWSFAITRDASGNIYLAGTSSSAWDGPGSTSPLNDYSSGGSDMVVVKLAAPPPLVMPFDFNKSSPVNSATNQPLSLTLSWSSSVGVQTYWYCYDTTNNNTCTTWVDNGTSTSVAISNLSAATTYYWHVRAVNNLGTTYSNGSSTSFWSFRTSPPPPAFTKSSPVNGINNQPTTLNLSWATSTGATSYEYCIYKADDTPCSTWEDNDASTTKSLSGLSLGTTYYWQVRASNVFGTTYANANIFWTFRTSEVPAAFTKSSPINGAVNQPLSLFLKWSTSQWADSYEVCYDTFDNDTCDTAWINAGNSGGKEVHGLAESTAYYWQVRARNDFADTYANDSIWRSFATGVLQSNTFNSTASNDGWTLESSEFSNLASTKSNLGTLRVGDDARNRQYRSLLYFDTTSLPNNAVISKVVLQIKKAGVAGTDPFSTHGSLVADMKKSFFGLSPLEATDFNATAAPINTAGKFSDITGDWYQLTLSPANFKHINLSGVTQFRLRFTKDDDNDKKADFITFFSGDDATNPPQLIVEFTTP